ncbi:MAG TPA: UMP kinase [Candidatus Levybacteria bacterium]|nr:UMP kinase [Candidatus Levybacteria bacterium]
MAKDQHHKKKIVISLGGSLIVPSTGIDTQFLASFNTFIRAKISENPEYQFFIVVGGGQTARDYRDAGRNVLHQELSPDDLDWLGIHASRLNAHLVRTIFRDIAHPVILEQFDIIRKVTERIVIGAGWRPGWSTDYCAVMVCEDYEVDTIINLSNIEKVYTADPNTNADAKPIDTITWADFQTLVGEKWTPGMNVPFDPIATKKAQELELKVVIMKGNDFENLENYFDGKEFVGTTIS